MSRKFYTPILDVSPNGNTSDDLVQEVVCNSYFLRLTCPTKYGIEPSRIYYCLVSLFNDGAWISRSTRTRRSYIIKLLTSHNQRDFSCGKVTINPNNKTERRTLLNSDQNHLIIGQFIRARRNPQLRILLLTEFNVNQNQYIVMLLVGVKRKGSIRRH